MSVKIWLQRHAEQQKTDEEGIWQPNTPLSARGREQAKQMRDDHLAQQQFAFLGHSPWLRARETARISRPGGDWHEIRGLAPMAPDAWDILIQELMENGEEVSLENAERRFGELIRAEREWVRRTLLRVAADLPEGEQALLISHQPLTDLVRGWLEQIQDTSEIYVFECGENLMVQRYHLRLPKNIQSHQ